jgi:hypothetical protein
MDRALFTKDAPFPLELAKGQSQAVYSVEYAHVIFLGLNGKRVALIVAYGTTVSTGWTDARLQPFAYFAPPKDGVWDFLFVAQPPTGPSADVLSHATASYVLPLGGFDLTAVRIHSATTSLLDRVTDLRQTDLPMRLRIGSPIEQGI